MRELSVRMYAGDLTGSRLLGIERLSPIESFQQLAPTVRGEIMLKSPDSCRL